MTKLNAKLLPLIALNIMNMHREKKVIQEPLVRLLQQVRV